VLYFGHEDTLSTDYISENVVDEHNIVAAHDQSLNTYLYSNAIIVPFLLVTWYAAAASSTILLLYIGVCIDQQLTEDCGTSATKPLSLYFGGRVESLLLRRWLLAFRRAFSLVQESYDYNKENSRHVRHTDMVCASNCYNITVYCYRYTVMQLDAIGSNHLVLVVATTSCCCND
jgi:hypothetical protein